MPLFWQEKAGKEDVHNFYMIVSNSYLKNRGRCQRMLKIRSALHQCKKIYTLNGIHRAYKAGRTDKLEKYRLADLRAVSGKAPDTYLDIMDAVYGRQLRRLKKAEKIKVAFVLYSASMWSCDDLYHMLDADPRFEPYVVVSKYTNESNKKTWPTYNQSVRFFEEKGYKLQLVADDTPANRGWAAMGEPDIVFYLTPYHTLLPVGINQGYLPARVLTVYIPYSYMLIKAEQKYDSPGFRYSWRHYCDSEIYRKLLLAYDDIYRRNTFFVGYPKMDPFFAPCDQDASSLWKLHGMREKQQKKIIYAPHHSLKDLDYCASHFATFDKNGQFLLEYARSHPEDTSWVVKPHPNLKMTVLMADVFKTEEEYWDYLAQWDSLPNAKVVQEGSYVDYFKTSDAMVCDSVSFLAEYQFTGKPLLLLTRPEQAFNEFGDMVQQVLYHCPGEDLQGINRFLQEVVIDGDDRMEPVRRRFFEENLNYYKKNGNINASEKIYAELRGLISD